jgi:hypothetical protein
MIGRGHVTFLDDLAHLEIAAYVQQGILRMRERHSITDTPADVLAFVKIAEDTSASGHALRTSQVSEAESLPSIHDLPAEVTVSQIEPFLPWGDHQIRRKIRTGEIPTLREKPYMLSRDMVLAIAARAQDHQGAA